MASQESDGFLGPAMSLTFAMAIGWVLCFWPARLLNGQDGVYWMSIASICCLVPGWFVVFLAGLAIFSSDLAAMLAQMAVRLFVVGGAAVYVRIRHPEFGPGDFAGWLIGFYLLALFTEVYLLQSYPVRVGPTADD